MATSKGTETGEQTEVEQLRAENARLRRELTEAREGKPAERREFEQHVPDFLPEGTRQELEATGRAINPFNGEKLGDWPAEQQ